jgi:hypothetical protein
MQISNLVRIDDLLPNDWVVIVGLKMQYDEEDDDEEEAFSGKLPYEELEQNKYRTKIGVTYSGEPYLVLRQEYPFVLCRPVSHPHVLDTIDVRQYILKRPSQEYVDTFLIQYDERWQLFRASVDKQGANDGKHIGKGFEFGANSN